MHTRTIVVARSAWLLVLSAGGLGPRRRRAGASVGSSSPSRTWGRPSPLFYTPTTPTPPVARRGPPSTASSNSTRTLTDYDPDSELMRLCARAGGPPSPSAPTCSRFFLGRKPSTSGPEGAFDVTIAPVVRLWRRARREKVKPDPDLLAKALALVGSDAILRLDPAKQTVELTRPGMKLDVGGIAKGYASEEAIKVLKREGIASALVAGSGDIVVSGPPSRSIRLEDRRGHAQAGTGRRGNGTDHPAQGRRRLDLGRRRAVRRDRRRALLARRRPQAPAWA